jgi:hypothetical protein
MFFRMSYWTSYLDTLIHFRFRHVNRRARILASELQEYKRVIKHGMEGFRSMFVRDWRLISHSGTCTVH